MAINHNNTSGLENYTIPKNIYRAISNAAAKTGVNFSYLMEKAAAESAFNPSAKAKTSSATGLFQFIESTWMTMVKDHGAKYGLARYADHIGDDGRVDSSKMRREILNLRKDPQIASYMAAEFASDNHDRLKQNVGGEIGSTELYLAHFLGAGGATGFLNAMKKNPNMVAADLFPREARANRNVFFDATSGKPLSLHAIYTRFDQKFDGNTAPQETPSVLAAQKQKTPPAFAAAQESNDPLLRLVSLASGGAVSQKESVLRVSDANSHSNSWQVFPPSLYGKLSLSPAQLMMLSDFNA